MIIEGTKINLRDLKAEDVAVYSDWLKPGHRWKLLDGPYYPLPPYETTLKHMDKLRERVAQADWPAPRTRLVVADRQSDRFVGMVSWYWESQETNWLSIGIVIYDEADWGQGIGTEALTLWCDYLWQALPDIVRLDLRTWSGNVGMMKLAEKLGFTLEARFRKARIVEGEFYDSIGYGILREEWMARRR